MRKIRFTLMATLVTMGLLLVASMPYLEMTQGRTLAPPPQGGCDIFVTSVSGDLGAFTVSGSGTNNLMVAAPINGMASMVVGSSTNAVVVIDPFVPGTTQPISVTASAIDPNQPASFSLTATDTVGHTITIQAALHCPAPPHGCTRTQGYWKNHANNWPVQSLTLGTVAYTKAALISILREPVRGNGLVSLAHQLIAAKLNAASGASVPPDVASAIAAADSLIGPRVVPPVGNGYLSPSSTSSLTTTLDNYNNGLAPGGPPHCDD